MIHSLLPKVSELRLVLTCVSLVDSEEEQDVEEEEDDESTDDAVDSLRGAGVGGIKAFLEAFFSATGNQRRGNVSGDVPAKQGRPKTETGGLTWLQRGRNVLCLVFKLCHCLNIELC